MKKLEWRVEKRKVKDLIPFEKNPRRMTKKQIEDLKRSIEKFDLVEIPVIDKDNRIIAGHQRVRILKMLGREEEEIEVRVPSRKLTEEEFLEYNLRSNKNQGEWDVVKLYDYDYDFLIDVGFEPKELIFKRELIQEKEVEIRPYEKIHILISVPPEKFEEVKKYIEEIVKIEGVEYEQSSN